MGLLIDQVTKYWAESTLSFYVAKPVTSFLSFQLVHNYGAAYGIFQNQRVFLLLVSLMVGVVCLMWLKRADNSFWMTLGLAFILIGAWGNFLDRLLLGYVIDFIDIRIFPVFNVADMSIDAGIACLVMDMVKGRPNVQ